MITVASLGYKNRRVRVVLISGLLVPLEASKSLNNEYLDPYYYREML